MIVGQQSQQRGTMAAGNYANEATVRQLEVPASVSRLDDATMRLSDAVSLLDDKLSGYVARISPPSPAETKTQLKGALQTGLGSQLDSLVDRVDAITARARDLYERLEA